MIPLLLVLTALLSGAHASDPISAAVDDEFLNVDVAIVGAGIAGLSAAHALIKDGLSVHVLEADARVGGRVRNYDAATGAFDATTDTVVEVGGTFIAPSHTALIALAKQLGLDVFNVTGPTTTAGGVGEPPDEWPWWWWSVDTDSKVKIPSVFHSFNGTRSFVTAKDASTLLDPKTSAELDAAGTVLFAEAKTIDCRITAAAPTDSPTPKQESWDALDAITFEGWIRSHCAREESRVVLRAMCRGMIAQEPSQVRNSGSCELGDHSDHG